MQHSSARAKTDRTQSLSRCEPRIYDGVRAPHKDLWWGTYALHTFYVIIRDRDRERDIKMYLSINSLKNAIRTNDNGENH